jgi:hypothetical protein
VALLELAGLRRSHFGRDPRQSRTRLESSRSQQGLIRPQPIRYNHRHLSMNQIDADKRSTSPPLSDIRSSGFDLRSNLGVLATGLWFGRTRRS